MMDGTIDDTIDSTVGDTTDDTTNLPETGIVDRVVNHHDVRGLALEQLAVGREERRELVDRLRRKRGSQVSSFKVNAAELLLLV